MVDRGFDCVTPLLHELTYEAMAHDVLDIDGHHLIESVDVVTFMNVVAFLL